MILDQLFEMCFSLFDEDGAGTISFSELQDGFAKVGFFTNGHYSGFFHISKSLCFGNIVLVV